MDEMNDNLKGPDVAGETEPPVIQAEPEVDQAADQEPVLDTSMFHLAKGEIADVIAHMKEWFHWRVRQGSNLPD